MDPDKEGKVAKKQKRGSKGKVAGVAQQGPQQVAGGSPAQVLQPAEEETVLGAADAAPHVAAKTAPAPAARKQTVKTKKDSTEGAAVETGASAKADKRPEKASMKRKAEGTLAAAEENAKTGVQLEGESADDAAPGGRRTRPGRARASKAPYWMGGAAEEDLVVTTYDSLDPAEAAEVTAKPKRGRKTSVEALQEEDVSEAAEPAEQPALAAVKAKRRQKKSAEDVQSEEAAPQAAAQELPGKSAAAGKARRKLVRAGGAAVNREEATLEGEAAVADQQAEDEPEAAVPPAKKGAQQKKARASRADQAAAHQHNQPEDMDPAGNLIAIVILLT